MKYKVIFAVLILTVQNFAESTNTSTLAAEAGQSPTILFSNKALGLCRFETLREKSSLEIASAVYPAKTLRRKEILVGNDLN